MSRIETSEDSLVEVVLASAAGMCSTRSITLSPMSYQSGDFRKTLVTHVGHSRFPTIIFPNGREYITAIGSQRGSKEFGTGPDIEVLGDDKLIDS